jgi:hypothetical protein
MTDVQDPTAELAALEERLHAGTITPAEQERLDALRASTVPPPDENPTGDLWARGPVDQPSDPLPELLSGSPAELTAMEPPGIPPPDPAFDAVVIPEIEEGAPEVSADDLEEVLEIAPEAEKPAAAVTWVDDEPSTDEVVSLEALLASPPPANAESLAPPLPPPLPPHATPSPAPVVAAPASPAGRDPFAPSASFVSGEHRIVLHTVEGQVLRGSLANADLCDAELPLLQPNGAVARVPADHVKAIFFMLPTGERPPPAAGTRVRVSFGDGRQVSGLSPDYSPDSAGFFVLPVDPGTHTARVWVYRAAARQITAG